MNHSLKLALAFAVVYVVWGSTYLAIRIAVHDLPPALMAGVRFLAAGLIMLTLARYQGAPWPVSRHDWFTSLLLAVLMVFLGNGLVTWGEQWVESNQAALLVSTGAIWTAFFGSFGARAVAVSAREKAGIAVGLAGALLMLWPEEGLKVDYLLAQGAILAAPISWSIGTIYARTFPVSLTPTIFTAVQMLLGGALLFAYGMAAGELPRWQWSPAGLWALAYLTVFGSCLAYGTYVWLIQQTSPARLGTITYVNPMVAVLLGWLVLGESLSGSRLGGALIIVLGVALVTLKPRRGTKAHA